ncbi:unnamed protein product [Adineta ricciae]|uniref:Uncharacterized protein n=1 Tax=Adineta ricciae TaxID=249248 RepID=A0A815GWZ7_ADIRI|nr:unnamed protein product [Adineta ricciae]
MLSMTYLCFLIFSFWICVQSDLNLYNTDEINNNGIDALQYNCLRTDFDSVTIQTISTFEMLSFCMNEETSRVYVEPNISLSHYTFAELSKLNVTGEQLFYWSTPIDVIEHYELYLISNNETMGKEIYYNCTLPKFGPLCQYEFDFYDVYDHFSSYLRLFYSESYGFLDNLTCYTHLKCDRGPYPFCLDWSEICNGIIDCLDYPFDEEHCSQIDIYDPIDEPNTGLWGPLYWINRLPTSRNEDAKCNHSPLSSSCWRERHDKLLEIMFSIKDNSTSDDCLLAFKCLTNMLYLPNQICDWFCFSFACIEIIEKECPLMFYIPIIPVLYSNIYFAYEKNDAKIFLNTRIRNVYICYYNNSLYDNYFQNHSMIIFKNRKCYRFNTSFSSFYDHLKLIYDTFYSYNQQFSNSISSLYKKKLVVNSHMISFKSIVLSNESSYIYLCSYDIGNLLEYADRNPLTHDGEYFYYLCSDQGNIYQMKHYIRFQFICNGFNELLSKMINGQNQTDESECNNWPCNNIYTRCDQFWNCLNGEDEIGCDESALLNCSSNEYICYSSSTNNLICLNINKTNDGRIDCLGAFDEPTICQRNSRYVKNNFYCTQNNSKTCVASDRYCYLGGIIPGDIMHCQELDFLDLNGTLENQIQSQIYHRSILCRMYTMVGKSTSMFLLGETNDLTKNLLISPKQSVNELPLDELRSLCYRGIPLRVWLNKTESKVVCLCPQHYYGSKCQYQNQRMSFLIKFNLSRGIQETLFEIIILLIEDNNQRRIHSYVQFLYLHIDDCETTFVNYLLYSIRSKNVTENYSIHIDIYDKKSLIYRGSFLIPIINSFLPVHRRNFKIKIPSLDHKIEYCSKHYGCVHGKCIKYLNTEQDATFCQCDPGWSGKYCTISNLVKCRCSLDSKCLGVDGHNRSICLCPLHKSGPRCLIINRICEKNDNSTCHDQGQCIPWDLHRRKIHPFRCICSKGFSGDRCQIKDNEIHLLFEKNFFTGSTVFLHFIEFRKEFNQLKATTTFKTISPLDNSLTVYWSYPFNFIVLEDLKENYYLITIQIYHIEGQKLIEHVQSSNRCQHINKLFNKTILGYSHLQRLKYYHLPCQESLSKHLCFYDNIHLCFCYNHYGRRLTNCLEFNRTMTFDCQENNECQNNGKCFQAGLGCKIKSTCLCDSCFYGKLCQFNTNEFSLSLDNILSYHIQPLNKIIHQSSIIQISIALNLIFIIAGLINGICTMITFQNKKLREVGCGLYLLCSSITTLIVTILLALKFWILICAQISSITNRLFLLIQCISLDYLLRVFLHMDQWLNACVACERVINISKAVHFNRRKSVQVAKLVIILLLIFNVLIFIHEPIHRHLIDELDEDEKTKRTWCIVTYSSDLRTYNTIISTIQFFAPFIINLVSAITLIMKKSLHQSNIQKKQSFQQILRANYREHKHLFISPLILIILAIPRLILTYISQCMKSIDASWLFLFGYFTSFIPTMLTFIIFVLPSKFYQKEFSKSISQYKIGIRRCLRISP